MKKGYVKPSMEIEKYELNASIASSCGPVVTMGPGDEEGVVCKEFGDSFGPWKARSKGPSFYDGINGPACDCYYTTGGEGYFTS